MTQKRTRKLRVVEAPPEGTTVLSPAEPFGEAYFIGAGGPLSVDSLCGSCDRLLIARMAPGQGVRNVLLVCPDCGSYNDAGGGLKLN
jgi:hypothetical protein